jgi:hypothetical protein
MKPSKSTLRIVENMVDVTIRLIVSPIIILIHLFVVAATIGFPIYFYRSSEIPWYFSVMFIPLFLWNGFRFIALFLRKITIDKHARSLTLYNPFAKTILINDIAEVKELVHSDGESTSYFVICVLKNNPKAKIETNSKRQTSELISVLERYLEPNLPFEL